MEFLENENIKFIPHKILPMSSTVCDIYLTDFDLYIELDGINREKRKMYKSYKKYYDSWIEKINFYEKNKLNYIVLYNKKEFFNFIAKFV